MDVPIGTGGLGAVRSGYDQQLDRAIFLFMQLLYGQTLADLIVSRPAHDPAHDPAYDPAYDPWPVSWAAAIAVQVAATLVDVHAVDVAHRDLKLCRDALF